MGKIGETASRGAGGPAGRFDGRPAGRTGGRGAGRVPRIAAGTTDAGSAKGDPAERAAVPRRTVRGRAALRGQTGAAYLLLAPSLFGVVVFLLAPVGVVIWLSFQRWDLISPLRPAGIGNYLAVFSDAAFGNSLLVTAFFVVIVIPVQTALGLYAATLLTKRLPGSLMLRTVYILPWVCAPLALGVVWKWILAPTGGLLNAIVGRRVEWLSDPGLALPSVAMVVVWTNVGYLTLFFMAGLLNIPQPILEAAELDGAGPIATFWRVKLPLMRPTMFFVLVTTVISAFQLFDQIYALTGGGPFAITEAGASLGRTDVVALRIYNEAFTSFDVGSSAAMAVVLLVILVGITLVQQRFFAKRTTYDLG